MKVVWTPEEQASIAYVFGICSAARLTFRNLTGPDYGVDQIIESNVITSTGSRKTAGFVVLQLKSTKHALRATTRSLKGADARHIAYWAALPAPAVFCRVHVRRREGLLLGDNAQWFSIPDLRARDILKPNSVQLSHTFNQLKQSSPSPVFSTPALSKIDKELLGQWRGWLESIMMTPRVASLAAELREMDHLCEAGQASWASKWLRKLNAPKAKEAGVIARYEFNLALAKALRRVGHRSRLKSALDGLQSLMDEEPLKRDDRRLRRLNYERAWHHILVGLVFKGKKRTAVFETAANEFRKSLPPGVSSQNRRESIIAESGRLHALSLKCRSAVCARNHVTDETALLEKYLRWWSSHAAQLRREDPRDFYRRRYNAQLALARWYLSHGTKWLSHARTELAHVEADLKRADGHHTLHSIAHFDLVRAWAGLAAGGDERKKAARLLKNSALLLWACLPDLELKSYYEMIRRQLSLERL